MCPSPLTLSFLTSDFEGESHLSMQWTVWTNNWVQRNSLVNLLSMGIIKSNYISRCNCKYLSSIILNLHIWKSGFISTSSNHILVMYYDLPFKLTPSRSIEMLLADKLNRVTYQYCARSWQTRNTSHLWTSLAFRACISPITFTVFMQSFLTRTSLPSLQIPHRPHRCSGKFRVICQKY